MAPPAPLRVVCPHCGTANRVAPDRLAEGPACGQCKAPLFPREAIELSSSTFDRLTGSDTTLVVDCWAAWCGPCRQMAPQFEQAAQRLKGRVRLAKVNTDENPALAARFGIRSIPTLVRLERGRETGRDSGALPAARIVALAESR